MINKRKILIVVDYQADFASPTGALSVPQGDVISNNIQTKINSDEYESVIYTFDTHTKSDYDKSDEKNVFGFPIHCVFQTNGWNLFNIKPKNNTRFNEMIADMDKPFEMISIGNEFFFTKDMFSIWDGNDIYPEWFEQTFPSDEYEVEVVGLATNYCVSMNVIGMTDRGYTVSVIENCVKGITNTPDGGIDESYSKNITVMKNRGVKFVSSKEV